MAPPRGRRPANRNRRRFRPIQKKEKSAPPQPAEAETTFENFDINGVEAKKIFLDPTTLEDHRLAQEQNPCRYLACLLALEANNVDVLQSAKIRALAAGWARRDFKMADFLLSKSDSFGVVEVLRAVTMLDTGRRMRADEKRMAMLKMAASQAGKKGKSRIGRKLVELRKNVNNLSRSRPNQATASGALVKRIKRWTRQLPAEQLEFFALHLPTEPWRQLADICHLHPEKDFPSLPWFLKYCFNPESAPDDALVLRCQGLSAENVNEYVLGVDIPFAHIKRFAGNLRDEAKARVARYTPDLDTVLWNYEDLQCAAVDKVVEERLEKGDKVTLPYGKLLERLLMMKKLRTRPSFYRQLMPFADSLLKDVRVEMESPVVVIGDASPSMDVAIEVSIIIGSLLRSLTQAQLIFFCERYMEPPFIPTNVEQTLDLATTVKTDLGTCPAAALWPFYHKKKVVKTFILVTDEEENSRYEARKHSYTFDMLFEKYYKEVYPAKCVFVSFLRHQHAKGQMVTHLRENGHSVLQFKLDKNRPDLSKMNSMIGQLALDAKEFEEQIKELEVKLKKDRIEVGMENMEIEGDNV